MDKFLAILRDVIKAEDNLRDNQHRLHESVRDHLPELIDNKVVSINVNPRYKRQIRRDMAQKGGR